MKTGRIVIIAIFIIAAATSALTGQEQPGVLKKVVIDAGHGGHDSGAVSGKLLEKDVTLAVAKKLGALITENYPDVDVIYTRKTDVYVDLDKRADIANKAKADLFISIHVNSSKGTQPSGTETFVMGVGKGKDNLDVAMRENNVITYEADYSTKYQMYEPGSVESLIMISLMQYAYQEQSLTMAGIVQEQYRKAKFPNRGVKQAGFLVLWFTSMPSILTELGFIGNASDQKMLTSEVGQNRYARSLFNSFSLYKTRLDGKGSQIILPEDDDDPSENAEDRSATVADGDSGTAKKPGDTPATKPAQPAKESPKASDTKRGVTFAVQIKSSSTKLNPGSKVFGEHSGKVSEVRVGKLYCYYVCETASYDEATKSKNDIRKTVSDAFVIAMRGGRTIPVKDAIAIAGGK